MFILDTNVVSELRKATKANPSVIAWASNVDSAKLFLSVISIMELDIGIMQIERRDAQQGEHLRRWFNEQIFPTFDQRILPIDTPIAQCCARLHVPNPRSERDALIAATALVHGMTVVTRNSADFEPTGVSLLNPWIGT